MKKLTLIILIIPFLLLFHQSCKKDKTDSSKTTQVQFEFSVDNSSAFKSALTDTGYIEGLTAVVVTIDDLKGNIIKNSEKVDLYNMNGYYISKPLPLVVGEYKLTRFLVLNSDNNIVYASPLEGSPKAYLVNAPLPISFSTGKDKVTKLQPEVLSTADCSPEDFGYASFGLNISNTFDFLVGVFLYDSTAQNFGLTTANISILSDTTHIYTGDLSATTVDSSSLSDYDKTAVTNKITLPERYNSYTIIITKDGYTAYQQTFTKEKLRLYYRSEDNGPLVVILDKSAVPTAGLVAYYPFDGNANDYSGNMNDGIEYSEKKYVDGLIGQAHDFNGKTDYIELTQTLDGSKGLSFSFWIKSRGCGPDSTENNGDVISKYSMAGRRTFNVSSFGYRQTKNRNMVAVSYYYDTYSSNYRDWVNSDLKESDYALWSDPQNFFIINPMELRLNEWDFVVVNCGPTEISIWINGILTAKKIRLYSSYYDSPIEPTYIGNMPVAGDGSNNHLNGALDELRVYNRALSEDEILSLYQHR